ncbi:hypothetical protein WJX79_002712 [Trebouxia sp. C0005]
MSYSNQLSYTVALGTVIQRHAFHGCPASTTELAGASSVQAVSCWLAVHNSCEQSLSARVQTNNAGCLQKLAVRSSGSQYSAATSLHAQL